MDNALFGYTGFVGNNLLKFFKFNHFYNSKNINDSKNKSFNKVFISCLPSKKWYANKFPEIDNENIDNIKKVLKTIKSNKIILISTIDVYENTNKELNEDYNFNPENNHVYGRNRYNFELFIKKNFDNYLIIRLPALFGKGLKKNIIFDLLNNNQIEKIPYNSYFQWYDLEDLYNDINICEKNNIKECNFFTEPLNSKEIFKLFNYKNYSNNKKTIIYNLQTIHYKKFNNKNKYIRNKNIILNKIKNFILNYNTDNNQLCVSNICMKNIHKIQLYSLLKLYNIKNIELAPTFYSDWNYLFKSNNIFEKEKIILKKYNIKAYSFQSICYTINENIFSDSNEIIKKHLKNVIDLALKNDIKILVFGSPKNRLKLSKIHESVFIDFMKELGDYIGDNELYLCIENNSKKYGCNFLNTINEVGKIVTKINNKNIKMIVDIGNCIMENDNLNHIKKYKDKIEHIHFSKPYLDYFINIEKKEYGKIKEILKQIKYNKKITLEFIDMNNDILLINQSLKNFTNFLKL